MIAKLIPGVMALAGLGAGVGAGIVLRPADHAEAAGPAAEAMSDNGEMLQPVKVEAKPIHKGETEFAEMSNQFVFPLVVDGDVEALVVLSLTLEVTPGGVEKVFTLEPKLRDGFLRVMLDHANTGGFRGAFTANDSMARLRGALIEKARLSLDDTLVDVLILNINRQDV